MDVRTDIYSLGATFYCLLTGRSPLNRSDAAKGALAIKHPAGLDLERPDIPEKVLLMIDRMMANDPNKRIASADRVIESMDSISKPRTRVFSRAAKGAILLGCGLLLIAVVSLSGLALPSQNQEASQAAKIQHLRENRDAKQSQYERDEKGCREGHVSEWELDASRRALFNARLDLISAIGNVGEIKAFRAELAKQHRLQIERIEKLYASGRIGKSEAEQATSAVHRLERRVKLLLTPVKQ